MTQLRKRRYDIGNGVIISDDGYWLHADVNRSDGFSTSIGVKRPPVGPLPDQLSAIFSQDEKHFYLHDFTSPHGYWLGTKKWASLEEMQAQQQTGIEGKAHARFVVNGEVYYRELLPFAYWKVRHKPAQMIARSDEMAQDYLSLAQNEDREQEKRFNEVIAPSGRTLAWLIKKLGAWLPFDPDPEPTKLTD